MRTIEIVDTIEIDCEPRVAASFAFDYANDPFWRHGVLAMRAEGPLQVGVRTYEELRFLGSTYVTVGEITERDEVRLAFRGNNDSSRVDGYRAVEARGSRARVTYALRIHMRGLLAFIAPLLRMIYARRVANDLRRLRSLLTGLSL
jgi:hypothetical protein